MKEKNNYLNARNGGKFKSMSGGQSGNNFDLLLRIQCSLSKTEHGALSLYDLFIVLKVFLCGCSYSD